MSERTITIEHNGATYYGHIATIKKTMLGYEDHGILSAYLHLEWPSGGVSVGGYALDEPADPGGSSFEREGTAYGLDHIIQLMETVGVDTWEKLPGKQVIVLFDNPSSLGSMSRGIAGTVNDKVFILKEHAEEWRARNEQGKGGESN